MHKTSLPVILAFLLGASPLALSAQCPLPSSNGTIKFFNQTEVDQFAQNFPNCTEFDEQVQIEAPDFVLPEITSLAGLSQVKSFKKGLRLVSLEHLTDLHGLENVESIGGYLDVALSPRLKNLAQFSSLKAVGGLSLSKMDSLENVVGLEKIDTVAGDMVVFQCPRLQNLTGLDNLEVVSGDLSLSENGFKNLGGLEKLTRAEVVNINSCGSLTDISALKKARFFRMLNIIYNLELASLSGLEGLDSIGKAGLTVALCHKLKTLEGLDNLKTVGKLNIWGNDLLQSLDGLGSLEAVETQIRIAYNQSLESLHALAAVGPMGSKLEIKDNDKLASLDGTENMDFSKMTQLTLYGSAILSACSQQNICDYLKSGGAATIDSNLVGCNSAAEILSFCTSPTEQPDESRGFQVSPNPVGEGQPLEILFENDFLGMVKIEIFSLDGRLLSSFEKEKVARQQVFKLEIPVSAPSAFFVRASDSEAAAARLVARR